MNAGNMEKKIVLTVEGLNKSFGPTKAVADMHLELYAGEIRGLIGENGSGKSTLAKLIAGIEKPTSGQIYFEGADITDKSITERAKLGIAFAFQQPVRFKGLEVLDLLRIASGRQMFRK